MPGPFGHTINNVLRVTFCGC